MMNNVMEKLEHRVYPCVVVVEPALDVAGAWVAHCLTFDVLAQADDPLEALELAVESTWRTVLDDLNEGLDPERRRAPDEDWTLLRSVAANPRRTTLEEAKAHPVSTEDGTMAVLIGQFLVTCSRKTKAPDDPMDLMMYQPMMVQQSQQLAAR